MNLSSLSNPLIVHGDIRHLEKAYRYSIAIGGVHGDIRHLEIKIVVNGYQHLVHGDIRHLENIYVSMQSVTHVHGDIRHLEMQIVQSSTRC